MAGSPPRCFWLEATRGPHTGSTHCCCSVSRSPSAPIQPLSIGRKKRCWLRLPKDLEVSSVHAEFRFVEALENETRLALRDVKSTNGTKLNDKLLKAQQDYLLRDGDLIAVGRTSLHFVQVGHGQACGEEEVDGAAAANTILTSSASSSTVAGSAAAPVMIELDEEEAVETPALSPLASAFAGTSGAISTAVEPSDTPADEPATEPDHGELNTVKDVAVIDGGTDNSTKEVGDDVELKVTAKSGGKNAGVVDEYTPEEATCSVCSVVIGRLNILEQQAHLNECIGGRVAITTADVAVTFTASAISTNAKPKTRKRENSGSRATRAQKPRKPKAGDNGNDSTAAALKAKKPRKRKRADTGEDIVLALALADTSKIGKEQQTDMQLAVMKKKIEELDEQMAKLAKRRVNLVKTLSRLEKTKEKLQKSQVLPPAKVLQLLDLKAALNVIFPSNRQAHLWDQRVNKKETERDSVVATRYTPSRWSESGNDVDRDKEKHAELAAMAAISMWKRASQQLFGLQRDSLLYRNSVLRAFLGDDEDVECGSIDMDGSVDMENGHKVDNEDTVVDFERKAEYKRKSELAPVLSDYVLDCYSEVPDVVKRVFPNWQRDLAFLHDQPADKIKMALEAMHDAQAEADAVVANNNELDEREGSRARMSPGHHTKGSDAPLDQEDQRLACKFMAQVMMQLIAEKRQRLNAEEVQQQQAAIDLVDSNAEDCQQPGQQSVVDVSENEAEEEPYNPVREELPKGVTAYEDGIGQNIMT